MYVRIAMGAASAFVVGVLATGSPARADSRMDNAVQTAIDTGRAVGAASACPDISPHRTVGLTERFKSAVKQFGTNNEEAAAVNSAFDQGVIFGDRGIGNSQNRCAAANRDLADWEAIGGSLLAMATNATAPAPAQTVVPPVASVLPAPAPTMVPVTSTVAVSSAAPAPASAPAAANPPNVLGVTNVEITFGKAPYIGLAAAPEQGRSRVLLQASGDAWMVVRGQNGSVLLNKLLREGDTWPVPPTPGLVLTTGNAAATVILVDGVSVGSLGGVGAVQHHIPLDVDRLKTGKLAIAAPSPAQ